jgi:hypothetical protein
MSAAAVSPRRDAAERRRYVLLPFVVSLAVVCVGAAGGGYSASAWNWVAIGCFWIGSVKVLFDGRRLPSLGLALTALVGAGAVFELVSATWSVPTRAFASGDRELAYAAAALAGVVLVRASSPAVLAPAAAIGVALLDLYSVATRLLPDRVGTYDPVASYRLSAPIGYWNALGILNALGMLLAAAGVARGRGAAIRAGCAAVIVLQSLTLYFTYSRGSYVALVAGIVALVAYSPRRLQTSAAVVVAAIAPLIAVGIASREHALTRQRSSLAAAAHQGHRFAIVLLVMMIVAAGVGAAFHVAGERVDPSTRVRLAFGAALVVLVLGAAAVGFARYGSPPRMASRAWHSFTAPPPKAATDLNRRLFTFSSNGRVDLWEAAWHEFEAHPILGGGAGSYEGYWLQHRGVALKVRNAHSLYLETLAEQGIVGLMILLVALAVPLVAAGRARPHPYAPFALAAYVAFLVHAAIDWDWQMPVVVIVALLCGISLIAMGAPADGGEVPLSRRLRHGLLAFACIGIVVSFVMLVGNVAMARATSNARAGHWAASAGDAKRAATWAPWSSEPLRLLGEAQLGDGDSSAAAATFRKAIEKNDDDWSLWFDLARATTGVEQRAALDHAARLDPLAPEIVELRKEIADQKTIDVVPR